MLRLTLIVYLSAIPLDSWSISNPTGHPVRSQAPSRIHPQSHWSPCAFTGMHLESNWAPCAFTEMYPHTNTQSRCPPHLFSRISGSIFLHYVTYKRQHGSACVPARCVVQSSGILVALWLTCVVLSRFVSSPVARRVPRGLPKMSIFLFKLSSVRFTQVFRVFHFRRVTSSLSKNAK